MAYYEYSSSDDEVETPREYWDEIADHESLRLTPFVSDKDSLCSSLAQADDGQTDTIIEPAVSLPPASAETDIEPAISLPQAVPDSFSGAKSGTNEESPSESLRVTFSKEALALDPEHIEPVNPVMQPQNMTAVELLSLKLPELKALARRQGLPITERVEGKSKVLNKAKLVSILLAAPPIPVTNVELPYGIAKPGIISAPINITAPADGPVKRGRGRPKGSKNKPKWAPPTGSGSQGIAPAASGFGPQKQPVSLSQDERSESSRGYDVEANQIPTPYGIAARTQH